MGKPKKTSAAVVTVFKLGRGQPVLGLWGMDLMEKNTGKTRLRVDWNAGVSGATGDKVGRRI